MTPEEIAADIIEQENVYLVPAIQLAQAYLALEARMEKLERVVAAAKFTCKSWNRNREEIYRRLDVIGSVLSFDPDYRHEDKLGLSEALAQLDEAGT